MSLERIGVAEARIDLALGDELRDVRGLRVVGEMAALEAFPGRIQRYRRSIVAAVSRWCRAPDDDHPAGGRDTKTDVGNVALAPDARRRASG